MPAYANLGGNSNVASFELSEGSILVRFRDGDEYVYTDLSATPALIRQMHALAREGQGLNSFIMRRVKSLYAFKRRVSAGRR